MAEENIKMLLALIPKFNGSNLPYAEWHDKLVVGSRIAGVADPTLYLPLLLEGPAYELFKGVTATESTEPKVIYKKLSSVFGVNPASAFEQLINIKLEAFENVDVYRNRIRSLLSVIGDSIETLFLVHGLPSHVAGDVRKSDLANGDEVVNLVRRICAAESLDSQQHALGGLARSRRSDKRLKCFACGKLGHFAKHCPQRRSSNERRDQGNGFGDADF